MFVNTLVLRTEVDLEASARDMISRARESDLSGFGHADVPFERLVEVLNPARSQARNPLFQVMLSLQNLGQSMQQSLEVPGLRISGLDVESSAAKFDLQFTVWESDTADKVGGLNRRTGLCDRPVRRVVCQINRKAVDFSSRSNGCRSLGSGW